MKSSRRQFLARSSVLPFLGFLPPGYRSPEDFYETMEATTAQYRDRKQVFNMCGYSAPAIPHLRVGYIGLGNRGYASIQRLGRMDAVEIRAICDVYDYGSPMWPSGTPRLPDIPVTRKQANKPPFQEPDHENNASLFALILTATTLPAAELRIGGATTSITPDQPVAFDGHRNLSISNKVESPVTSTALALESRDGDKVLDQAITVSCDLVAIRDGILKMMQEKVKCSKRPWSGRGSCPTACS